MSEALTLADQRKVYTRRTGLGPWTQLADEAQRLQILTLQGHYEKVLTAVRDPRDTMARLPEQSEVEERAIPWNVREVILNTGVAVARDLQRWEEALALNAEVANSQTAARRVSPGADAHTVQRPRAAAKSRAPAGGQSVAARLPAGVRGRARRRRLGKALSALADLEDELGQTDSAVRLVQDTLRLVYSAGGPDDIAASHFKLADVCNAPGGIRRWRWRTGWLAR